MQMINLEVIAYDLYLKLVYQGDCVDIKVGEDGVLVYFKVQ